MARIELNYFSQALGRGTDVTILLPGDGPAMMLEQNPYYQRPCKTLFLLHGFYGCHLDWPLNTGVNQLSIDYNLAIVCPSGENSFYLNQKGSYNAYDTFVGVELVDYLRKNLGIALTPEDTFIGGLSMGGYGAIHLGLAHPESFSKIIALSSALIYREVAGMKPGTGNAVADYDYYFQTFGAPETLMEREANPEKQLLDLKAAGGKIPDIFMAVGTDDMLRDLNRVLRDFFVSEDVPVVYYESPGIHDWKFWNEYLEPSIRWALEL